MEGFMMLSPGANTLEVKLRTGEIFGSFRITVGYLRLLQLPPVYLAVLVARDSPLLSDWAPVKYGSISTTQSSIDAVIAKLRMSTC